MDDVKGGGNWRKSRQDENQLPVTYKGQLSLYVGESPFECRQQTREGLAV
jgi:hypothetical protein